MNDQALERLVIDQHLGELSEDVANLLEAYLGKDPAAAHAAHQVGATLTLARQSLRLQPSPALPRLKCPQPSSWRQLRDCLGIPAVQLAAACLMGLLTGYWLAGVPSHPPAAPNVSVASLNVGTAGTTPTVAAHDSFWSKAKWVQRYAVTERNLGRSAPLPLFKNPQPKSSL